MLVSGLFFVLLLLFFFFFFFLRVTVVENGGPDPLDPPLDPPLWPMYGISTNPYRRAFLLSSIMCTSRGTRWGEIISVSDLYEI